MSNFKIHFLVNLLLVLPLMSDPRAPDGQCYIVLPVDNEDAAIEELDINPKSLEVYESDDARTTYVTLGKTYIDLFNANKNIFPSNTRCSKGNNLGSYYLWLIEDPGMTKSYLIDSYILGEKAIGSYGFDRIAIKDFVARAKDIDFLFSSNVIELKKRIEPYSTFINKKGIEFRKAEETRIAKENAALEAKKIALAKAAEEEANKKAAAEAAALQAIADAEEAKQLQKEKRRTRWLWVGIICLFLYSAGRFQRKRMAKKAGFNSIKEYEQHLKDKQREEEEKLLQKAAEEAGFNSVEEHKRYLFHKKAANAARAKYREAEAAGFNNIKDYEQHLKDSQREKANQKSSDGSLLKTAAGVAVTAAAIRAASRPNPPRIIFKDPNFLVTEVEYIGGIGRKYLVRYAERKDGKIKNKGNIRIGPNTSGGTAGGGYKVYWDS